MAKCCGWLFEPKKYTIIFFIYMIICIVKYSIVGYWTIDMNNNKEQRMSDHKQYGCDCYFVSKDQQLRKELHIPEDVRFDAAYAIPECTTCTTCDSQFHSADECFNSTSKCPVYPEYENTLGTFNFKTVLWWRDATGCYYENKMSVTSMVFWVKHYHVYSRWAWGITILYGLLLLVCMTVILIFWCKKQEKIKRFQTNNEKNRIFQENKGFMSKMDYVMKVVYLYNILVSVGLLYLFYKPIQFHHRHLTVGANKKSIICEVNSMPMEQENMLGICAIMTVCSCFIQLLYTFIYACKCCKKCIKTGCCVCCDINIGPLCKCDKENKSCKCCCYNCSKHGNYGRKESMSDGTAELIHKYSKASPICLCCPHTHFSKYLKCRNIFALIMAVFLGFTLAAFVYIYKGVTKVDSPDDKTRVLLTLILLPLSFIDNPWSWKTITEICGNCLAKRGWQNNISINIFEEESDTVSNDGRY